MTSSSSSSPQPTFSPSKRQFDVCSRPANPAKRIKSPHNSPPMPSSASEGFTPITKNVDDEMERTSHADSDASSELSSSSEEPSDDSDDSDDELATSADNEDPVVNLRANRGQKPTMKFDPAEMGDDIRGFLKDFLPKLKAANDELEAQKAAGTLKTVEIVDNGQGNEGHGEEEQYIELNLGLGVLEEKDADATDSSGSEAEETGGVDEGRKPNEDVLRKLMGQEKANNPAGIEVVDEPKGT